MNHQPRSLREALAGKLNDDESRVLPSSYTMIGDIAVLELDDRLLAKKKLIGGTLLHAFPRVRVAALKVRVVSGEYRLPGLEVIAGENRTETIHREFGCAYKLDVAQTYFSPRLASERMRVVGQIRDWERVLVMFAGVGPYAILAAKKSRSEITAAELNPKAVEYMRQNVLMNKVMVNVIEGDVRATVPMLGLFDRIIMPLPKQADTFLDIALPALRKDGVIHYYTFAHNKLEATEQLTEAVVSFGRKLRILGTFRCGSYSPSISRICVEFTLQ